MSKTIFSMLDIREEKSLEKWELVLAEKAKLNNIAPVEAWTAVGTNKELSYCTHGLYRYFGKFPAPIASHLIREYSTTKDLVIDPMCGSGTSGVEAYLMGRRCILADINPLSVLLSKVKTTKLEKGKMLKAVNKIINNYKPLSIEKSDFKPTGLRNFEHWFLAETVRSLSGIRACIMQEKDPDIRDFLLIAFAAIVRRVSRATTQQGRLFLDKDTAIEDCLPFFEKKALDGIKRIEELPEEKKEILISQADLKDPCISSYENKASVVILHPPYFNSYKYSAINSLEMSWLGFNPPDIRKSEIREYFKVGKPENVDGYIDDMSKALSVALKALKKGGHLGLMIGDTVIRGQYIPVTKKLLDASRNLNYSVEKVALRVPKYTEATWVSSQRRKSNDLGVKICDFVVTLKKV